MHFLKLAVPVIKRLKSEGSGGDTEIFLVNRFPKLTKRLHGIVTTRQAIQCLIETISCSDIACHGAHSFVECGSAV
jgi:hypothetical protein